MTNKSCHDSYAKGAGGFGNMGQAVDVEWVLNHGSRGQLRRLERYLKKEVTAKNKPKAKGGKK